MSFFSSMVHAIDCRKNSYDEILDLLKDPVFQNTRNSKIIE